MYQNLNKENIYKNKVNETCCSLIKDIGCNLRYLRRVRKLSRRKLIKQLYASYKLKLNINTLMRIESNTGKANIEIKTLSILGLFFNKRISELMFYDLETIESDRVMIASNFNCPRSY